jgi:very-short-patch-repair endonuclease
LARKKSNKKDIVKFLEEKGKEFSEKLRKNATQWELSFLETLRSLGYKFEFQVPIICNKKHLYILDFLLVEHNIFIELDGKHHFTKENIKKDNLRTKRLRKEGYEPLRFTNTQIDKFSTEMLKNAIDNKILLLLSKKTANFAKI